MMESIKQGIRFVSEAAGRIFSPSDDHYPSTGVQPFEGSKTVKMRRARWTD